MESRQTKRTMNNVKNKYLCIRDLDQLSCSRYTTRSCTDVGNKRILLEPEKKRETLLHQKEVVQETALSPIRVEFPITTEASNLEVQPQTPKTQQVLDSVSVSSLESLPTDLLVKILCYLHHDQLTAVFHVSRRLREAVFSAQQLHFNYITPDRSRQAMLSSKTPIPTERSEDDGKGTWDYSPHTPKAPKHGPRSRVHLIDITQISVVLFPESTLPPTPITPPGLPRSVLRPLAPTRVLLYEDEICQAVAHNKLL